MLIAASPMLAFYDDILREPDPSRIVLWLRGERDGTFQHWERVSAVNPSEGVIEVGLCFSPATVVHARERRGGYLRKLFSPLTRASAGRLWLLPNGSNAEQYGERESDRLLVGAVGGGALEEAQIKARWPQSTRVRQLGPGLFLGSGVHESGGLDASANAGEDEPAMPGCPRVQGERLLAAARARGDSRAEAVALTDLGIMSLSEGDSQGGTARLEKAFALARQCGDRVAAADILGHLGLALLHQGQPGCPKAVRAQPGPGAASWQRCRGKSGARAAWRLLRPARRPGPRSCVLRAGPRRCPPPGRPCTPGGPPLAAGHPARRIVRAGGCHRQG